MFTQCTPHQTKIINNNSSILDIGSNDGTFLNQFTKSNYLLGVDPSAEKFKKTNDPSLIWEGHRAGMHKGYSHIEKLCNLEELPDKGFLVSAFPFKIKNGSAGFVRVVAILD